MQDLLEKGNYGDKVQRIEEPLEEEALTTRKCTISVNGEVVAEFNEFVVIGLGTRDEEHNAAVGAVIANTSNYGYMEAWKFFKSFLKSIVENMSTEEKLLVLLEQDLSEERE